MMQLKVIFIAPFPVFINNTIIEPLAANVWRQAHIYGGGLLLLIQTHPLEGGMQAVLENIH